MVDFGGFVGIFETSQVEPAHGNHLVVSFGAEKGSCRVYSEDGRDLELAVGDPYATVPTWETSMPRVPVPTEARRESNCVADFVLAIRRKTRDYPTIADGAAVQGVLDAILQSAKSGRWVNVKS